ncbi:hypothetical protein V2J09_008488 [Rumex salicifolius]
MPEMVNISVNGESRVPPGFRFHPTEEELLQYYLRKKVAFEKIDLDVIVEVDLNKLEPWDIQERCKIGSTPQNDWYFFNHKDKKYPTGTRTNRATIAGFWKATGRDKIVYGNGLRIGMRKTLVFYTGRAPHGQKSDWIMHEYRLNENGANISTTVTRPSIIIGETGQEEGWVVCRIFKKKHFQKFHGDEANNSISDLTKSPSEGTLEQIFQSTGGNPTEDKSMYTMNNIIFNNSSNNNDQTTYEYGKNMTKLPSLKSPTTHGRLCAGGNYNPAINPEIKSNAEQSLVGGGELSDWTVIDRLLAAHLSEQDHHTTADVGDHNLVGFSLIDDHRRLEMSMTSSSFSSSSSSGYNHMQPHAHNYYYNEEVDLWNLVNKSSLPPSSQSDNPCNTLT